MRRLAMFPLGMVLMPSQVVPLHIFESRYRTMMDHLIAGDETFGVCLIDRGHEVGGGDQRSSVGTLARIVEAEQAEDGRWLVMAVGLHRIRIDEWLPDDPYPLANVTDWFDEPADTEAGPAYARLRAKHLRVLGMAAEAGFDVGPLPEIADDPALGSFQLAATAPITPFDRQRLLSAPGVPERLGLLDESLDAAADLVEFELAARRPPDG